MALVDRIREVAEERLGVTLVDRGELGSLRERSEQFERFREEASELAYHSLDYFSGRPQELRYEKRQRLAQRSRVALMQDPLAGAEANLRANFAIGRGVPMPDAEDEEVQRIIEEAWTDPVNEQKLTSYEAQRHRSDELLTQAQLFPVAFIRGGRVRLGFLDADCVTHVVTDPEDEERPLWYVVRQRRVEWDFTEHRVKTTDLMVDPAEPRIRYYAHWRNVEVAREERRRNNLPPLEEPRKEDLAEGVVHHVRINRIGRTQFGTPPWARSLRFFAAMNSLTESHVAMAQAASTWVAKRVLRGGPETITRAANAVLAQTGEIGAASFGEPPVPPTAEHGGRPPQPGSFWLENESDKLETLALNSGASQAAQTAQIVRAPIAAASGFGQHYLGDASNANLATATSLELPTQMEVQAWQETFRGLLKWFADIIIETALRAGRIPMADGAEGPESDRALGELRLTESVDRVEAERRTGRSLGYTISMPFPGRRNLPDVTAAATTMAATFDPRGENIPLRRHLLRFFATHGLQVDDPQGFVDEVFPEELIDAVAQLSLVRQQQDAEQAEVARAEREAQLAQFGRPEQADPSVGPRRGDVPARARGVQEALDLIGLEVDRAFRDEVLVPLYRNGSGPIAE